MEFTSRKKGALLVLFMLSCCLFLLPRSSSAAPLSRSLSLRNRQQPSSSDPALEVPAQGEGSVNLGEVAAARMDIEVNDYPGSGANNRHEPRSPGRS